MSIFIRIWDRLSGNDIKKHESRNVQLTKALKSWKDEYSNIQLEVQALRDTCKHLRDNVLTLNAEKEVLHTKKGELQDAIEILKGEINNLTEAATGRETACKAMERDLARLRAQLKHENNIELSQNEQKIIKFMQDNPGSRQKEAVSVLKMNRATVSNVLKGLVSKSIMVKNESRGTYQINETMPFSINFFQ